MLSAEFFIFAKKGNSTAIPSTAGLTIPIELKAPTDILNPEIILSELQLAYNYNYVYISQFGRYYHILNWRYESACWVAMCKVDVLASYRAIIGATPQYILRASAEFDGTISDNAYPTKFSEHIYSATVATLSEDRNIRLGQRISDGYFIVGVIDKRGAFGAITYYVMNYEQFSSFMYYMFHDASYTQVQDISMDLVKCLFNPFDYVVSVMWFPVSSGYIPARGGTWAVSVGYWDFSDVSALMLSDLGCAAQTFTLPAGTFGNHPQIARGAYLNSGEYRQYSMNFPPYGTIDIPADVALHGATIYECVDFITGKSTLTFFAGTGNNATTQPILTVNGEIGIPLQIAQIKPDSMAGNAASFADSMQMGVASLLAYGLLGDSKISRIVGNTASAIGGTKMHENAQIKTSGNQGGFGAYYRFTAITAQAVSQLIVDEDNNVIGRPLCKVRRPDAIPGYMIVGTPVIAISGTAGEKDEILSYLSTGFYYE